MPLQNRVQPDQTIRALPGRGLLTGNRGILHDGTQVLRRRWASKAWICCTLTWKDIRRRPMSPGTWTELFFLDEAVALAAGHRPCALCRPGAWRDFKAAWIRAGLPGTKAPEIDAHLHASRLQDRKAHHPMTDPALLPDFSFVLSDQPFLLRGSQALPYGMEGYGAPLPRPTRPVPCLTPEPILTVLAAGYRPLLHPTAGT